MKKVLFANDLNPSTSSMDAMFEENSFQKVSKSECFIAILESGNFLMPVPMLKEDVKMP